jgi:hypothetical protein
MVSHTGPIDEFRGPDVLVKVMAVDGGSISKPVMGREVKIS